MINRLPFSYRVTFSNTGIDEHRRILKKYHGIANIVHVSNSENIKNEIVGMIKIVLMNHVKDFDCKYFQDAR